MSKKDEALKLALEHAKRDERHMNHAETRYWCRMYRDIAEKAIEALAEQPRKKDEALKQSLITEAAIQSKDHPSKDARTFAKSVHEYLMAEQPAQHRAWFTVDELNAWADKKLKENPQWAEQPAQQGPVAHVMFRQDEDGLEPIMFYGPGTAPDPAALKDRFVLKDVWLSPPAQQKPAGSVYRYGRDSSGKKWHGIRWTASGLDLPDGTLIYTSPPAQRKPLTDEEWQSIADTLGCFITRGQKDAIEAALGIKENT